MSVKNKKNLKELSCYESKLSNLDLRNQTELEVLKIWKKSTECIECKCEHES